MTTGEMLELTNYLKGVKQSKASTFTKLKYYYSLLAQLEKLYRINAINKSVFEHSEPMIYRLRETIVEELNSTKEVNIYVSK